MTRQRHVICDERRKVLEVADRHEQIRFFFFKQKTAYEITMTGVQTCALPIYVLKGEVSIVGPRPERPEFVKALSEQIDRKSTRLNSSHLVISYAVFCLKK